MVCGVACLNHMATPSYPGKEEKKGHAIIEIIFACTDAIVVGGDVSSLYKAV